MINATHEFSCQHIYIIYTHRRLEFEITQLNVLMYSPVMGLTYFCLFFVFFSEDRSDRRMSVIAPSQYVNASRTFFLALRSSWLAIQICTKPRLQFYFTQRRVHVEKYSATFSPTTSLDGIFFSLYASK